MGIKDYDIWCEGYRATGESGTATLLGHCTGTDFKDACKNFAKKNSSFASYFNENSMTYWGCKMYDNGADARKTYG